MIIDDQPVPWQTLGELIVDKAGRHVDKVFAEIAGVPVTYNELEANSRHMACRLLEAGFAAGDRVASFMANAPEQLYIWFASVRAGLVWVPLNAGLVGEDLSYSLRDSGARILIADEEQAEKFCRIRSAFESVALYTTGASEPFGARPFAGLIAPTQTARELPATRPQDPGAILYTGGTTGLPKGVVLPQFSFILAGVRYARSFDVRPGERHFSTMPLFHAGALQWGIMGPLVNDMTTVIERRFSAQAYLSRVRETRANVIDAFGVVMTILCAQPESPADRDHCVRLSVGAVAGIPPDIPATFTRRFGIPLVLLYGLTEGGGAMLTTNRDRLTDSNGRPHGWVEILIADEHGFPVKAGATGDVLLRPKYPHMFMTQYFNDPVKTLQSYRDCWLHTGDLGKVDEHGNFWFVGRKAHWIRRRGESISAVEVEAILAKCPGVHDAAVVSVPSELGEDEVKAFVVRAEGAALEAAGLLDWCGQQMAAFKIPRFVEFIDVIPRSTAKMEIDRGALRRLPNDQAYDRARTSANRSGAR